MPGPPMVQLNTAGEASSIGSTYCNVRTPVKKKKKKKKSKGSIEVFFGKNYLIAEKTVLLVILKLVALHNLRSSWSIEGSFE